MLYELLCDSPPFGRGADGSPVAVAGRHLHQPPEPPSARTPQVDASLDAIVLTALAKDAAQRYQSAVDRQDALEQVLAGDEVATGPAVRGSGRRPRWLRWALPVAGMALGIGLLAAFLRTGCQVVNSATIPHRI